MTRRVADVFDGAETILDLIAEGLSKADAIEVRAFAVFLRRRADDRELPDAFYAFGEIDSTQYLEAVAPEELAA